VGRKSGVRPADLVGAIANESGVPGRDIGVRIFDSHSVVEVPASRAAHVIDSMRNTIIRGKRATVRHFKEDR
jgi:ATP-dependent RNA helicase DeaD